jgi:hypothetical protein
MPLTKDTSLGKGAASAAILLFVVALSILLSEPGFRRIKKIYWKFL